MDRDEAKDLTCTEETTAKYTKIKIKRNNSKYRKRLKSLSKKKCHKTLSGVTHLMFIK